MGEDHQPVLHGPRGVADETPETLRARILGGWDAVLALAASAAPHGTPGASETPGTSGAPAADRPAESGPASGGGGKAAGTGGAPGADRSAAASDAADAEPASGAARRSGTGNGDRTDRDGSPSGAGHAFGASGAAGGERGGGKGVDLRPLAELGSWPGRPVLGAVMAAAHGRVAPERRPKPFDPSPEEILDALTEARARVVAALDEVLATPELGRRIVDSPLGPLPVLTQIHAMGHEAAQAAQTVTGSVPPALADAGLAAMVDVVGALAWRSGIPASAGLWEPDGGLGWVFTADADGWRTHPREAGDDVPGVEGAARHLLVSTGSVPAMLARGEIRLRRVGGLLALAPLVEQVPNLPGGSLLRKAVSAVSVLGRLPGFR